MAVEAEVAEKTPGSSGTLTFDPMRTLLSQILDANIAPPPKARC